MEDLGKLQEEILGAIRLAAKLGDGNGLSVLGPIAGEMERKCQEWKARFHQVTGPNAESAEEVENQLARESARSETETHVEDFMGKSIRAFEFGGERLVVGAYKEMLLALARQLVRKHPERLRTVKDHVHGRKPYFSDSKSGLRHPREVKPGLYIETNFPANQAVKVCRDLVEAFGYPATSLRIDVVPFRTRAVKRTARSHRRPSVFDSEGDVV